MPSVYYSTLTEPSKHSHLTEQPEQSLVEKEPLLSESNEVPSPEAIEVEIFLLPHQAA